MLPVDALAVFTDPPPEGLRLLHAVPTVAEAELLRQVLNDAGFHAEYVSSSAAGVFGITGNNAVYVQNAEYDEARAFLDDYLNPTAGETGVEPPPLDNPVS